jgi:ferrous iron transport protein A
LRQFDEFQAPGAGAVATQSPLSAGRKGFAGVIVAVRAEAQASGGLAAAEIERRLLEMGFVEGAPVEILHEGFLGRDPIAVKLADRTVALRRREARAVIVDPA